MKTLFFIGLFSLLSLAIFAQNEKSIPVETYTLKNGLTVYLNPDHSMPMVQGMVVVKGGSKRDPKDATGIAHYFEHIMFKGTDKIGTINYAEEKPYLDSISDLYEDLGKTVDEKKRLEIQKEINRISIKASDYAIPNEVDKILNAMGGKGMNAGTGYESIVYYNSCPSNQVEKWLEVYSERFKNPVFRLFQSELETVFEEKNMYADNPMGTMLETFLSQFSKNTPYGQQTILGKAEHLKNPSLKKMGEYFDKYYIANNMALILSGDFDPEAIKPIIDDKFGVWRTGETPKPLDLKEPPFNGREVYKKRLTPIKVGIRGYHTIPHNHPDKTGFEVCASILSNNAQSGLLDQLRTDGKILFAGMENMNFEEIGGSLVIFIPKIIGQSLEKAEQLVDEQIKRLRTGDFDDELLLAVKTEMKKQHESGLEDMRGRAYTMANMFLYGETWEDYLETPAQIDKVTKEDIMKIANTYFGDNYLAFLSKMGFPKKDKVKKPPYKAVQPKNSDQKSEYAKMVEEMPIIEMAPRFIDFEKDVICTEIADGITTYITPNTVNSIFSISLVFGKGTHNDPIVSQAASMFGDASPEGVKFTDFKRQLQLLGCEFYAYSDLNRTTIHISGLEENFEKSISLMNELINKLSIDEKQLKQLSEDRKMEAKMEAKDISTKGSALYNYALYGNKSSYLARLSEKEIKSLTTKQLITKMNEIMGYKFEIRYCGTQSAAEFEKSFTNNFTIAKDLKPIAKRVELERNEYKENTILLLDDKKAIQSHIYFVVEGDVNNEESMVKLSAFNDYIGGSMASIIFQEIREFRSLAYGSSGNYNASFYRDQPGYFKGWLSTQSDKTLEAIDVFTGIIAKMPEKPERIESVRKNLTLSINASQPSFRWKSNSVANWKDQGYNEDPRKARYSGYETVTFNDIVDFYNTNIKDRPWVIVVAGDKSKMDMEQLKKYGAIKTLKLNDIIKN